MPVALYCCLSRHWSEHRPLSIVLVKVAYYATSSARFSPNYAQIMLVFENYARVRELCYFLNVCFKMKKHNSSGRSTVDRQSVERPPTVSLWPTFGRRSIDCRWQSADCRPIVRRRSTDISVDCRHRSTVDRWVLKYTWSQSRLDELCLKLGDLPPYARKPKRKRKCSGGLMMAFIAGVIF